jgi:hypothetical protein
MESSGVLFTTKELERARRYRRPLYIALLVDTCPIASSTSSGPRWRYSIAIPRRP